MEEERKRALRESANKLHEELTESVRRQFGMSESDIERAVAREKQPPQSPNDLPKELPLPDGRMVKLTDTPWNRKHWDEIEAILRYRFPDTSDVEWNASGM